MNEQSFLKSLQEHMCSDQDALSSIRQKGLQRFSEIGLPSKSQEAFRYVPLREFYLSSFKRPEVKKVDKSLFSKAILPECAHSHLIFVDGVYSAELSDIADLPEQMVIASLEDAMQTHGSFLQSCFARTLKDEKDPFAYLNLALHAKGVFVYLPPKIQAASPLQCLYISTCDQPQLTAPRIHLALGSQSSLRCIVTQDELVKGLSHFVLPMTEISLEDGAHLDILNVLEPGAAWHFETLRATLKKNAALHSLSVTFGGKAVRQSYRIQLKGENSEAHLNGLCMLKQGNTAHTHAIVDHEAPHTRSMQKFKGILKDNSQSSFEGKILVRPEAQKTEAYQLNNNLILSQGAIANSKPNLEVFADDVKASHGATISRLDDDQLFYLTTRGIQAELAKHLLIGSFYREMIGKIPYHSVLRKLDFE